MPYNQTQKRRYKIIRLYHLLEKVDQEFYNPDEPSLRLIDPILTLELNGNGTLEFTMPYGHKYFSDVLPMSDEFMVRDEVTDDTLFVGRPISCEVTDFERVKVYCEGALGYLHDILIRPKAWEATTPRTFLSDVVIEYNTRKAPKVPHQEIHIGNCDIPDREIYRYSNYDKAYTLLERGCLESDGGYIMMTYGADGKKTINWYKVPESAVNDSAQNVSYGENIVSFNESIDLSDSPSFAIVLGAKSETEELPGDQGRKRLEYPEPLGLGLSAAGGPGGEWEWQWLVRQFGYSETLFEYDEPTTEEALKTAFDDDPAVKLAWPERQINVECNVADLHFVNNNILKFYLGQRVNLSVPNKIYTHLADVLYVTRIRYDLTSAVVEILVGELPKRSLSDQFRKREVEEADTSDLERRLRDLESSSSIGGGGSGEGIYMYLGDPEYEELE